MTGAPAYGKRRDSNHKEILDLFVECGLRLPHITHMVVVDTADLGGIVGDGIVQYFNSKYGSNAPLTTKLLEIKSGRKKKLTQAQINNPLLLTIIWDRKSVFETLCADDWELV